MKAEQVGSQAFLVILQSVITDSRISQEVRDSVRRRVDAAINAGAEPFFDMTLRDMGAFLTGMRALRLDVDTEFRELSAIRQGIEEMAQRNQTDATVDFAEDGEFTRRAQALWARISLRLRDVLTVIAQTAPPNARELVDAFTGEP